MKKALSLLLVLLLFFSLCACGSENSNNPILGTWSAKNDIFEYTISFNSKKDETTGHVTQYNFDTSTWEEHDFTVKEQTDSALVLVYDDGTIFSPAYTIYDDVMVLQSMFLANTESENVTPQVAGGYTWVLYDIYSGIQLGCTVSNVNSILSTELELERGYTSEYSDYDSYIGCPLYAYYWPGGSDVYSVAFGFALSSLDYDDAYLVNIEMLGHGEKALSRLSTLKGLLDDYKYDTYSSTFDDGTPYISETYTWNFLYYTVEFNYICENGSSKPSWYAETYHLAKQ